MEAVTTPPSWAYDFCYYFLGAAAVITVASIYSLVLLWSMPSKKGVPIVWVSANIILSAVVAVVLTMMQFWVCRSALAPKSLEKFFDGAGAGSNGEGSKNKGYVDLPGWSEDFANAPALTGKPLPSSAKAVKPPSPPVIPSGWDKN